MAQINSTLTNGTTILVKELFPGPVTPAIENSNRQPSLVQQTVYASVKFRGWNGSLPVVENPDGTWTTLSDATGIQ